MPFFLAKVSICLYQALSCSMVAILLVIGIFLAYSSATTGSGSVVLKCRFLRWTMVPMKFLVLLSDLRMRWRHWLMERDPMKSAILLKILISFFFILAMKIFWFNSRNKWKSRSYSSPHRPSLKAGSSGVTTASSDSYLQRTLAGSDYSYCKIRTSSWGLDCGYSVVTAFSFLSDWSMSPPASSTFTDISLLSQINNLLHHIHSQSYVMLSTCGYWQSSAVQRRSLQMQLQHQQFKSSRDPMSTMVRQPLIQYPNGDRFEGQAINASALVQGTYFYGNGDQYKGTFINQMKHGFGIYNYVGTGEVYEGEWHDDLWHGKGLYYLLSGEVRIKGTWERGVMNGPAEVVHSNGDRFVGCYRSGAKEGDGEVFYGNGAYFKGKFSEDKPNGYGLMRFTANSIYEGSFKNGLKHGSGKMTTAEGVYSGGWAGDEKNGLGSMRYANEDYYEGGWRNGLREGEGEYRYGNKDTYRGEWARDKKEGKGVLSMESGDCYNGEWRNGKKHGFGRYTFANEDFYEGEFVEGNRFGRGRYVWTDGSIYEGEWKGDKMNGQGLYRGTDGAIAKGLFVNDELVKQQ